MNKYFLALCGALAGSVALLHAQNSAPTFNKDIAPIIFDNCASCHRAGEVAPFPLLTWADVKKKGETIIEATGKRLMPPWKADEGAGRFHDARLLTDAQIALIEKWVDAGAPEGNAADLPKAPEFPQGWMIGEPDLVLQPAETFTVPVEGRDVYQCFVVPTSFSEDRWVSAMEVRPGNRRAVHHVIAYIDTTGTARRRDAAYAGPGYQSFGGIGFTPSGTLGGWAPGNFPRRLPDDVGVLLPKGADVVLQVHYHPTGKPETDCTRVGLYFAKGPVDKRLRVFGVRGNPLKIPPGDANHTVRGTLPIPADVTLVQIMPHMHLIGREMAVHATLPDDKRIKLIRVPDWDFNWQMTYRYKEPVKLPSGTLLDLVARYDNSAGNPRNPSKPPKFVTRGEQTTDEMCIAFLFYTVDSEHLTQGRVATAFPDSFGAGARDLPGDSR